MDEWPGPRGRLALAEERLPDAGGEADTLPPWSALAASMTSEPTSGGAATERGAERSSARPRRMAEAEPAAGEADTVIESATKGAKLDEPES